MLSVKGLTKSFGRGDEHVTALDGVDFDVAEGELVTVLGPSGCGKTTLLRMIAGFESPDAGSIHVDGRAVAGTTQVPAHQRGIGLVPQEGALFPHLSVEQNVGFGLRKMPRKERRATVARTLDLVGLGHLAHRRPHELSGGQQQRIALARALAPTPRIVLLDEPFSALDAYLRDRLRLEVRELLTSLGTTAVLVTHDQEEALSLGDRVAIMREGHVVQMAEPREAYQHPNDLDLARFLGDAIVVDGEILAPQENNVRCVFGSLPVARSHGACGACRVMIRPEDLRIDQGATPGAGLCGTVLGHTFYGHDGVVDVSVPGLPVPVKVRVQGGSPYRTGDQVTVAVTSDVATYAA